MLNTLQKEKLRDESDGAEKAEIEKAVRETFGWLGKNLQAQKDELEAKLRDLEGTVNPIIQNLAQEDEKAPGQFRGLQQ